MLSTLQLMSEIAMLPAYQIRKLPGEGLLWQVVFKFENGRAERWVAFNSEVEARNWAEKKLRRIASNQRQNAEA